MYFKSHMNCNLVHLQYILNNPTDKMIINILLRFEVQHKCTFDAKGTLVFHKRL